ncbi:MAG: YggT family protein [Actinomycetes bacterium]
MSLLVQIAFWLIEVFRIVLWIRIVLDLIRGLNPRFRPKGIFIVLAELSYTLTDWAIKPLAKLIKPLRIGSGYIDLSVLALLLILIGLEQLLSTLF